MTTRTPKYKAKYVYWDTRDSCVIDSRLLEKYRARNRLKLPGHIKRFDSQHEFRVYLELVRMYKTYGIYRQYPVYIIKPCLCYPNGKTWQVDFAVFDANFKGEPLFYVEAKGCFLPEFAHILSTLEQVNFEAFKSLTIVFPNSIPKNNKVIKALLNSDFKQNLLTLNELKQLIELP